MNATSNNDERWLSVRPAMTESRALLRARDPATHNNVHKQTPRSEPTRMKIHALTTGTVSVEHSFLFPGHGPRRQLDLFLPGNFSDPLPIHC